MSRLDETIQAKKEKRVKLEEQGVLAHPYSFDSTHTIAEARQSMDQEVTTAGRIMALRLHGKLAFADIKDTTGQIQVMLREDAIGEGAFEQLGQVDTGDFLGVSGKVGESKTGEITVVATTYTFLGKALRPLPTAWNAAEDKEARFRKRYLDMLINPTVKQVLDARWLIEKEVRRYLQDQHEFVEVETPILQPLYGGTNAKPFVTYMNALDTHFYLRLAPELYLKRLIVGGYDRIFEIARNFRNEGIDQTHQPEFTMIEWYQTYADYQTMMNVAEGLIKHLVEKLYNTTVIKVGEHEVDFGGEWPRISMIDALKQYAAIDYENSNDDELQQMMVERKIELIGEFTRGKALFALFDKLVPQHLVEPTWIIDYPRDVSPLAKKHRLNPILAERFEAYIGGKELADGWSEITDPMDQRNIFENEQQRMRAGDSEAHPLDEDFIEAMEHGMPPLGGIGMGLDRLVMFLTNTWSIREVIAFPTLRPLHAPNIKPEQLGIKPEKNKSQAVTEKLPSREESEELLNQYVKSTALLHHCHMVAAAMESYAQVLGEDTELWYQTGLLHDLDWEKYPDEHPNRSLTELLESYPQALKGAIAAHFPDKTGKQPETLIERYLYACDEISGLMHAASLMRPNRFSDMEASSIKKKIKDKSFAANVNRDDITRGIELIDKTSDEHIAFLIEVFKKMES